MSANTEDIEVKTSAEGASTFVDLFYQSASERRNLSSFYVNDSRHYRDANIAADISVNGLHLDGPAQFESVLETQAKGGRVMYDVEGFDAHVLNRNFVVACPEHLRQQQTAGGRTSARDRSDRDSKISIMVMVNGAVQFGKEKDALKRPFTEVFVLVPNWDSMGPKAPRAAKRFLILSQNYRAM